MPKIFFTIYVYSFFMFLQKNKKRYLKSSDLLFLFFSPFKSFDKILEVLSGRLIWESSTFINKGRETTFLEQSNPTPTLPGNQAEFPKFACVCPPAKKSRKERVKGEGQWGMRGRRRKRKKQRKRRRQGITCVLNEPESVSP